MTQAVFFKMAVSRFLEGTDEEIYCFKENLNFSNNELCNYTNFVPRAFLPGNEVLIILKQLFTSGSVNIGE